MNDWIIGATGAGPLLDQLHGELPGTEGVVLLSTDGLELATSAGTRTDRADQLSAVAAGLHAIALAADRNNGGGRVDQTVVEMDYRMLVVVPVTGEMLLAVVFDAVSDLSGTRVRIATFADRLGVRLHSVDMSPLEPELQPVS
ncbi:roadblock/LC7 domain-containing protein [Actinoplanes subtropicus]|uniref:roadblock/LC7 domain-containing protein n=1 Tax=Actinoplanes subtropicus TaxID=543632 RepID=UPI00069156C6|nr:roadblock/LC7 domain-containing protein [Actinoplanes subtropicus]